MFVILDKILSKKNNLYFSMFLFLEKDIFVYFLTNSRVNTKNRTFQKKMFFKVISGPEKNYFFDMLN